MPSLVRSLFRVRLQLDEMYDVDLEFEVREWMEAVSEEPFPEPDQEVLDGLGEDKGASWASFYASLRDGAYLCKYAQCSAVFAR